ncbi:hypothetical protein JKP88DRAFT_290301 [Tribonema minus]|uniref:Uncharacterized protein n=1 Tax=Tribonema minus TaxID=303371 RepID=A0A835Z5K8_9STRA|nr:hypothetical protein JKP88DRAFT_290301 [Tribonema minus]
MALRLARAASAVIQALALLPLDSLTAVDAWATGTKLERYASLEVLRNETVVHEVGVTDGLLQVKADGGAAAGSSQQRTILHDKRWAAIEAATLAGNMEPLAHLIASAQRRVDEVAMPCQCHSGIAVITTTAAAADAHMAGAARMSTADTTAPLDVHFDLPEFVAAFRGVANALSRACHHERRAVIQRELDGFLQLAAGHDAMRLGGLANVQVLGAVRTALEWLLGTIDQVHRDMLNNQLRAMTTYLRTEGASHESGLAYSRLAAAPYCLRATRHFVHRAVAIVTAEASGASSDATLQANATALLSALRASPSPSTAAVAGLLVRGVLGGVLVDTKVAGTGACRGPCEAPETLVFDGMRLQQSAAAVETSAAAAAIAMAVTGTGRGLGPQHTAQLLTLLEAPDLTPAHIAAQAVQWAQGQGAGVSSCSSGTAAHVRGVVMAICERQSPLRELYLRRCLLAVSSMTAESRCCGGSAGRTSDAYAAFIAEALVRTEQ